ncbi:MAG: hypothetical protein KIT27_05130 [Legionellales bacterium]|nr:hypothetical protein [Legionellales bacterium]
MKNKFHHEMLVSLANDSPIMIEIIIDFREKNNQIVEYLENDIHINLRFEFLPLGDYQFLDTILFERKTLRDYAQSIIDGRLFSQAQRLAQSKKRGIFIIEGSASQLNEIGVSREAMQGALISVSVILGIPVLRSQTPLETAKLMLYTAKQAHSISNLAYASKVRRPKGKKKLQLHILQSLPSIGPKRAEQLLASFGSVENVITASIEDLQLMAGIGKKTAEKIQWAVK